MSSKANANIAMTKRAAAIVRAAEEGPKTGRQIVRGFVSQRLIEAGQRLERGELPSQELGTPCSCP